MKTLRLILALTSLLGFFPAANTAMAGTTFFLSNQIQTWTACGCGNDSSGNARYVVQGTRLCYQGSKYVCSKDNYTGLVNWHTLGSNCSEADICAQSSSVASEPDGQKEEYWVTCYYRKQSDINLYGPTARWAVSAYGVNDAIARSDALGREYGDREGCYAAELRY